MAYARQLSCTAQALFRVFVQPTISVATPRAASRIRPQLSIAPAFVQLPPQRRTAIKYRPPVERTTPYDEEIGSRFVNLVDTKGVFQPRQRLDHILYSMDRDMDHLVQVAVAEENSEHPFPTCKIVSKEQLREQDRAKEKLLTRKNIDDLAKTVEINWAVDHNDLEHWLKRLREFLDEGRRVEVVLGPKKRGRKASMEEAQAVLDRVNETVESVQGAKERVPAEGEVGGIMTLLLEGRSQSKEEKQKEKEKRREERERRKAEREAMKANGEGPKVSRWKVKEEERRKKAAAMASPGFKIRYGL